MTPTPEQHLLQRDPRQHDQPIVYARMLSCVAILTGLGMMLPLWNAGPLVLDEHGSYWMIHSGASPSVLEKSLQYAAIPPLSGWVQRGLLDIWGESEFRFRLCSYIFTLGAIAICLRIGTQSVGPLCGGLTACLLIWHPEAIDETRIARCYGLVLFLATIVTLATDRWTHGNEHWSVVVWWVIGSAGLLWTHYTSALLVFISSLCVVCTLPQRASIGWRPIIKWGLANGIVAALSLPLVPAVLRVREWGPFLNYSGQNVSWLENIDTLWVCGLPVAIVTSLLFCRLFSAPRVPHLSRFRTFVIAACCSSLPVVVLAFTSATELSSLANPRYRVAYAPAAAFFISSLILRLCRNHPSSAILSTVLAIAAAWGTLSYHPLEAKRLGGAADENWLQINMKLKERGDTVTPIFVQSGLTEASLLPAFPDDPILSEYVACRVSQFYLKTSQPRYGLPFLWETRSGIIEVYQEMIVDIRKASGKFWVAAATDTDLNQSSLFGFQRLAETEGFIVVEEQLFPHAVLRLYESPE